MTKKQSIYITPYYKSKPCYLDHYSFALDLLFHSCHLRYTELSNIDFPTFIKKAEFM